MNFLHSIGNEIRVIIPEVPRDLPSKASKFLQQWQRQLLQKQTKKIAFLEVQEEVEEVEEEGLKKMTNNPCSQTWRQGGLQVAHLFQPTGHVYTRWAGTNDTNPVLTTCGKWQVANYCSVHHFNCTETYIPWKS